MVKGEVLDRGGVLAPDVEQGDPVPHCALVNDCLERDREGQFA